MLVHRRMIPEEIICAYNLHDKFHNDMILVEISKGMYGLSQAGRLAYDKLLKILHKSGFEPTKHTPGLFRHNKRQITFCLVADDFGVKYVNKNDVDFLIETLQQHYKLTMAWEERQYCGVQLDWDYRQRSVTLSIPQYVQKALTRFQHSTPTRPQHSPFPFTPITYGRQPQIASPVTETPLTPKQKKWVQEVVGIFLYYGRQVDGTMLAALSAIGAAMTNVDIETVRRYITHFLEYAASNPDVKIKYVKSEMLLWAHFVLTMYSS